VCLRCIDALGGCCVILYICVGLVICFLGLVGYLVYVKCVVVFVVLYGLVCVSLFWITCLGAQLLVGFSWSVLYC